jgi:ABC-type glycerol-3-phosphate transport system substrate-binding protein
MKRKTTVAFAAVTIIAGLGLTACSSGGSASSGGAADTVKQNAKASITVFVDDTRQKPAQQWAKANPQYHVKIEVPADITQQTTLALKAKKNVPDVIFLGSPDQISTLVTNAVDYPLVLNNAVPTKTIDNFAKDTVSRCTIAGNIYCLPNDIAQTVMYYNKTLFTKFGYAVPTTFNQWKTLGDDVAAQHPGYSLGSYSGLYGLDGYFGSSGCQVADSPTATTVKINVNTTACTRVASVLGPMAKNGTLTSQDFFAPSYVTTIKSGKLLAAIAPSWMGLYGIEPNYTQKGDYAVAPMPTWAGAKENYSGAVGGGLWVVSKATPNEKAALAFAEGMSTENSIIGKGSTYPAYKPAAKVWLKSVASDPWYAEDPSAALTAAAGKISPTLGYVRYQTQALNAYGTTILTGAPTDINAALTAFGAQLKDAAAASGYKVLK